MTALLAILMLLTTPRVSPILDWMTLHGAAVANWLYAHPDVDIGFAIWAIGSFVNRLQSSPKTSASPVIGFLRRVLDVLAGLPHRDATSFLTAQASKIANPYARAGLQLVASLIPLPLPSVPKPGSVAPALVVSAGGLGDSSAPSPARVAAAEGSITGGGSGAPRMTLRVALIVIGLGLGLSACAGFLARARAGAIDCLNALKADAVRDAQPQVSLLLPLGGSNWPALLDAIAADVGKDGIMCQAQNIVDAAEGALAGALPGGAGAGSSVPSAHLALSGIPPSARMLTSLDNRNLALLCAGAEINGNDSPPTCSALPPADRAYGRAKVYLQSRSQGQSYSFK